MAHLKILEVLQSLSKEEKQEFPLFLNSPFFLRESSAEELLRLYHCSIAAAKRQPDRLSDKPKIHAAVFPEKAFSAVRLDRAFSKLVRLIEQYLVTKNYLQESNELRRALDLASIYREKRMISLYEKNLKKIKKGVEENRAESSDNYLFQFQIACEAYEWQATYNKAKGDLTVPQVIEKLDLHYLTKRIEVINVFLLQHLVIGLENTNMAWFVAGPQPDPSRYESKYPVLLIQKSINELLLMSEPSPEGVDDLFKLIIAHEKILQEETIKMLYTFLRNFCAFLQNSGNHKYLEILHQIHRNNLESGYLHYNGQITPHAILNMTIIALKAKNLQWAKQLVESNRYNILAEQEGDEIYKINKALYLFEEKKYEESLQNISFSTTYVSYQLCARRLELKIYYELKSELMVYKLDAFRKYLERTAPGQIPVQYRDANLNFVKFLLQLNQPKPIRSQRPLRLIQRIHEKKHLAEREWLIEKAKELF